MKRLMFAVFACAACAGCVTCRDCCEAAAPGKAAFAVKCRADGQYCRLDGKVETEKGVAVAVTRVGTWFPFVGRPEYTAEEIVERLGGEDLTMDAVETADEKLEFLRKDGTAVPLAEIVDSTK